MMSILHFGHNFHVYNHSKHKILSHVADPYLIPLVDGINPACPIVIEFDHSAVTFVPDIVKEYFRIDNMPIGATYTSSTLEYVFKSTASSDVAISYSLNSEGSIDTFADVDITGPVITKDTAPNTGMATNNTDFAPTDARTFSVILREFAL